MPKLTQILKSVGKTINLAKPQGYQVPRKPPLNSLVFEKLPETKASEKIIVSKPPSPKPVRVCTKEELQAMYCCPCPCDCKVKTRMTPAQKIAKALLVVAKSMIVGALIYYTWAEGLWSDSEHSLFIKTAAKILLVREMIRFTWKEGLWSDAFHSSCFLGKFIQYCPEQKDPELNEFGDPTDVSLPDPEPCLPFIPRSDFLMYSLVWCWNKFVLTVFWVILEGPFELWQILLDILFPKPPVVQLGPCDELRARKT